MTATAKALVEKKPPTKTMEDEKIIPIASLRTAQERKEMYTKLVTDHHRDLLIYARSIVFDADQSRDLVQESCITAWGKFQSYDPDKADFGAWLRGILRNKVRDWAKSRKGGKRPEITLDEAHLQFLDESFARETHQPAFEGLKDCLKKLPPELQTPIKLTYYEGHGGQEASDQIGINYATLRKRLSRARSALHDCLMNRA